MANQVVYVVVGTAGQYDTYHVWNELATFDRSIAALHIERQVSAWHQDRRTFDLLHEFAKTWEAEHGVPERVDYREIPRWPGGLGQHQITPEMQAERAALKAHNEEVSARYRESLREHYERLNSAKREYIVHSLGVADETEVERLLHLHPAEEPSFSIEELKVVDSL